MPEREKNSEGWFILDWCCAWQFLSAQFGKLFTCHLYEVAVKCNQLMQPSRVKRKLHKIIIKLFHFAGTKCEKAPNVIHLLSVSGHDEIPGKTKAQVEGVVNLKDPSVLAVLFGQGWSGGRNLEWLEKACCEGEREVWVVILSVIDNFWGMWL